MFVVIMFLFAWPFLQFSEHDQKQKIQIGTVKNYRTKMTKKMKNLRSQSTAEY
jgi:hypothetical protein